MGRDAIGLVRLAQAGLIEARNGWWRAATTGGHSPAKYPREDIEAAREALIHANETLEIGAALIAVALVAELLKDIEEA